MEQADVKALYKFWSQALNNLELKSGSLSAFAEPKDTSILLPKEDT